jgi:hypothetical protein
MVLTFGQINAHRVLKFVFEVRILLTTMGVLKPALTIVMTWSFVSTSPPFFASCANSLVGDNNNANVSARAILFAFLSHNFSLDLWSAGLVGGRHTSPNRARGSRKTKGL